MPRLPETTREVEVEMEVVYARCCGLDVHKKSISACIVIREQGKAEKLERRFGTYTGELEELAGWLAEHRVTHVVMEATGVYWRPVWNVLEGRLELMLVNPQHVKALSGKKFDRGMRRTWRSCCSTGCCMEATSRRRASGSCAI